jgi:asparagine synthase (glutamine-hydrolysing)
MKAAEGVEVRDPTADVRILEYTYSVPDHIYINPSTGQDRWLIREAMKGRLPDEVRLNRGFGRQAADRVMRLRNCAAEVNCALEELAHGPASIYVDVAYMRQVWQMIQKDNTQDAFIKSGTILLRGIMAGLFVNDFYK